MLSNTCVVGDDLTKNMWVLSSFEDQVEWVEKVNERHGHYKNSQGSYHASPSVACAPPTPSNA